MISTIGKIQNLRMMTIIRKSYGTFSEEIIQLFGKLEPKDFAKSIASREDINMAVMKRAMQELYEKNKYTEIIWTHKAVVASKKLELLNISIVRPIFESYLQTNQYKKVFMN